MNGRTAWDGSVRISDAAWGRYHAAMKIYNARFDSRLYAIATNGKSVKYCNALIDAAMALCGAPWYKLTNRKWGEAAIKFLECFC